MYIYIFMRRISLTFYLLVSTLKTTKPTDKNYSVFGGDRQRYSSVRLYSLEAVYLNGGVWFIYQAFSGSQPGDSWFYANVLTTVRMCFFGILYWFSVLWVCMWVWSLKGKCKRFAADSAEIKWIYAFNNKKRYECKRK